MPIIDAQAPRGRLSARLEAVLEELGPCELLVDLCADHARVALAAVARGQARRALAIDLHRAPLVEAMLGVRAAGLEEKVLLVRGDGLGAVRRAEVLLIAGVGGDLAAQLLERSKDAAGARRLIVQPERHGREVRAWARDNGFHLIRERLIPEGRRLHPLLTFVRAGGTDPSYGQNPLEVELTLGPHLLVSKEPEAAAFLAREHKRLRKLAGRRPDLESTRAWLSDHFKDR